MSDSFIRASQDLTDRLIRHIIAREEAMLSHDGRGVPIPVPFVPCPANIGNDPCDPPAGWDNDPEWDYCDD